MLTLSGNNQKIPALFRGLLTIAFLVWLLSLLTQYYWVDTPEKQRLADKIIAEKVSIESLTLPPLPASQKPIKTTNLSEKKSNPHKQILAGESKKKAIQATVKATSNLDNSTLNKQRIEQVYKQLSDEGVDIQIAWPRLPDKRQTALNFMYQCVGMQFAVLNGSNISKFNQTNVSEYSDWIRVAQGSLSRKEHNWLNAYDLTGTPIRLFPRDIDWRLAQLLVNALKGLPLTSFRANYQVTNQKLYLINIYINNQRIKDSWTLYQGGC